MIYLDNAATTALDPEVLEAMMPYLTEEYGNPSATYGLAAKARTAVQRAREKAAELIGAEPDEIIFTSGGTEADNMAIRGLYKVAASDRRFDSGMPEIITSAAEHPAVLETVKSVAEYTGCGTKLLKTDKEGIISPDEVKMAVTGKTGLISLMMANNEVAAVNDIAAIGKITRERGILFHTDAVQAFGHMPIDVATMEADALSASAHKLHGPKGVGLLYLRRGIRLPAYVTGGGQERGLRSGTENVAGIVGFGKACEIAKRDMLADMRRIKELRDKLVKGIMSEIDDVILTGPGIDMGDQRRTVSGASFAFKNIEGSSLLIQLDMKGICASTGSACSASEAGPSHVLRAIEVPDDYINGSLRMGLSKFTTEEEIDAAITAVKASVAFLRSIW